MPPATLESSIGMDRLATRNEVRCALIFSAPGWVKCVEGCDDLRGMNCDFDDHALRCLDADSVWAALSREMLGPISN